MRYLITLIFLLFYTFIAPIDLASAHGNIETIEKNIGNYTLQLLYEPLDMRVGELSPFIFRIKPVNSTETMEFDYVFVRVNKGEAIQFNGNIANSLFGSRIVYSFPTPGEYTISIRFVKDETSIAEASFPVYILPVKNENNNFLADNLFWVIGASFICLALIILIFYLYMRVRKKIT